MKALSKKNKIKNDQMKANLENNKQLSEKFALDGEKLLNAGNEVRQEALKTMSEEQVNAKGKHYIDEAKRVSDLSASEKEKFLFKYSSNGNRQYQKRIQLA